MLTATAMLLAPFCLYGVMLSTLAGSQDEPLRSTEVLQGLGSPEWEDRKRAVGKIKVSLSLLDDLEVQGALLGTCRHLLDSLVSPKDHLRHDQLLRDIVYLVRRLRSLEALPCLMDLPMDNGWISVPWVKAVVGSSPEPIIDLLKNGNKSQKSNAARVLSGLHLDLSPFQRERVKKILMSYVGGPAENHDVRVSAIYGLVAYPEPAVVEMLGRIAKEDAVWHMINGKRRYLIREAAAKALEMIQAR